MQQFSQEQVSESDGGGIEEAPQPRGAPRKKAPGAAGQVPKAPHPAAASSQSTSPFYNSSKRTKKSEAQNKALVSDSVIYSIKG
jgi:hypothetical protein